MISAQLPDGFKRAFDGPVTVAQAAASFGAGLAKAAPAGRVGQGTDAKVVDSFLIDHDQALAIVTDKDTAGLHVIISRASARSTTPRSSPASRPTKTLPHRLGDTRRWWIHRKHRRGQA